MSMFETQGDAVVFVFLVWLVATAAVCGYTMLVCRLSGGAWRRILVICGCVAVGNALWIGVGVTSQG